MFEKHKTSKPETAHTNASQEKSTVTTQAPAGSGRAAVIGPGIHVNGQISGDENLLIEGSVDGKILLESHQVDVGQGGKVKADIAAKVIRIAGEVRGDLNGVEKVIISRTGNVHGNIVAPRMTLEDGALFKGSIDMDPGEPVKAKTPKPVSKPVEKAAEKSIETPTAKPVTDEKPKNPGNYSLSGR